MYVSNKSLQVRRELADNLLQQILQGRQALDYAVLIHHQADAGTALLEMD